MKYWDLVYFSLLGICNFIIFRECFALGIGEVIRQNFGNAKLRGAALVGVTVTAAGGLAHSKAGFNPDWSSVRSWLPAIGLPILLALIFRHASESRNFDPVGFHYLTGLQHGSNGEFAEAQAELKKALEIDPFDWAVKGVLELAEDALKGEINRETAILVFNALLFSSKNKFQEAIDTYKKAIAITTNYAPLYNSLGCIYGQQGMVDEGITELKKAIAMDPNYAWAYNNIGWAYHKRKGMVDEAIVYYKRAVAIDTDYAEAYNNLGLAYGEKEMIDDAIRELKHAIAINPNLASAHNDIALGYFSKRMFKLAIEHADKARELGARVNPEFLGMLKPYR